MRSTEKLTRASLLLSFIMMSFGLVDITIRSIVEVGILLFTCKNIDIKYGYTMALLIPIYSVCTGTIPTVLNPYVVFIIASNIVFVTIINITNRLDIIAQVLIASMAKVIMLSTSIFLIKDIGVILIMLGLLEVTAIGGILGGIGYIRVVELLHKRNILN